MEGMDAYENKMNERPVRLLQKPDDKEYERLRNIFRHDTKTDLESKAKPFLNLMKKYKFRFDYGNGKELMPTQIALFERSKTQKKEAWVELLAIFYYDKNFTLIFEDMPEREIKLWRETLRNHYLAKNDVNEIMGKNCFRKKYYSYYNEQFLNDQLDNYFDTTIKKGGLEKNGYWREDTNFIYVNSSNRKTLLKEFFPDLCDIEGLQTLPEGKALKTYNGESIVFAKLAVLASLYESGTLGKGFAKLTAATVKKTQKALMMPDFFDTFPDKKQPPISTGLMANFYLFYRAGRGKKKLPAEPEALIKDIIAECLEPNAYTLPVCLPYIKGIKRQMIDAYNLDYITDNVLRIIKEFHKNGWLPIDSLIMNIRTNEDLADDTFQIINLYDIDSMELRNGFAGDCYIHPGNIVRQLSEPFVKSLMFLLATFGIVDIAYREPEEGDTSYYDGLQYVRLTELGKYVLGISKTYTPQLTDNDEPAFELDSERLLIKLLRKDSPFVPLLSDYAESVSPSLYRVSYESFLKGCTNAASVKRKTKMFRQYICGKLPNVWKEFFKRMENRTNSFLPVDSTFITMRLSPDDRELQRLVLTEPSIRKYVTKAENYILLVKENEMKQFANALRKFGYLLEF